MPRFFMLALMVFVGLAASPSTIAAAAPGADLSASQTDSKDPVRVGRQLVYTITVHNAGPDTAQGIAVTDDLPGEPCYPGYPCDPVVRFKNAHASGGTCFGEAEGFVSCSLDDLASGESATVRIVVVPLKPGSITNSAFVGANNESDYGNNSSAETTAVVA